ncbi:MAG: T9SS type A sorting domain-containing protein, partial [Phaeodactylibacter sp.]|nr:T9SS type A sorting domain-containing protein [Phaeodactylibacter sp.]
HIFNNYYSGVASTGINSRMGACLGVENNYFKDSQNPIVSAYSDELGGVDESGSIFDNVTWDLSGSDVNEPLDCTASIPYSYSSALNNTVDVPSVVVANVGVGQITSNPAAAPQGNHHQLQYGDETMAFAISPNPATDRLQLKLADFSGTETLRVVDVAGVEQFYLELTSARQELDISDLPPGMYVLQLRTGGHTELKIFVKR